MKKTSIEENEINRIVEKMKKKYRDEGIELNEISSNLKELRNVISENTYSKIDLETEDDVEQLTSKLTKNLGNFYLKTIKISEPIKNFLRKLSITDDISYYLYSANMRYSVNQYLALASAASLIITLFVVVILLIIGLYTQNIIFIILLPAMIGFLTWVSSIILILLIPRQRAIARGEKVSLELPFALRHMATELKAGIGLYKTIQTIASNDYGVLSEEFAQTIVEIEEGADTTIALKHTALRTQSAPLKKTINHILRTMRLGGNLSNIMNDIAEDISNEFRNRIKIFSQKMNFFSVIFIFIGIVLPVAIMILGAIRNSPVAATGEEFFKNIPLTPEIMFLFYIIFLPILFAGMIYLVYISQPKL